MANPQQKTALAPRDRYQVVEAILKKVGPLYKEFAGKTQEGGAPPIVMGQ